MAEVDPIILQLRAEVRQYRNDIVATTTLVSNSLDRQERSVIALENQIRSSSGAIGASFRGIAGTLAGAFTGRELVGIIDSFTQFENKLKVAGVASQDLGAVQDRLFASAQKYGVGIGELGGLFGSLTQASKELGASQEQVFSLTDAVSAALKVSGASASEASGSLLQLGQALRGGTIQAEEYNSLLDGLFPLLEAAANGSDRFGGSVAKLTALVKAGKVSSAEFFNAILSGSEGLQKRAATATLTLSGAYTTLSNALTVYVGEAANTSGVQSALATGLTTLADNIDTVVSALAVIGATLAVKYVASAGAATLATIRADAALLGLTTRAEVAGFAIGTLGRALAINGLIAGVTLAIGGFASELTHSSELVSQANAGYSEMRKRLDAAASGAHDAGNGARGVGAGAASAEPKVRSFAGAVGDLANQLYNQAKAARSAKLELLGKRLADSQSREVDIGTRTATGRTASREDYVNALSNGDFTTAAKIFGRNFAGSVASIASGGGTDRALAGAYGKQVAQSRDLQRQLREAQNAPLQSYVDRPVLGGGNGKGKTKASGSSGASPATKDAVDAAKIIADIQADLEKITRDTGSFILSDADKLKQSSKAFTEVFGEQADPFAEGNDAYKRAAEEELSARLDAEHRAQDVRADNVRSLANLYEDLFQGGTDAVWQNFKDQGLRTLALILAQATITSFAKGGGGFGGLLGNIGSAVKDVFGKGGFGRASGGYVAPYSTVRVNEGGGRPELLRMGGQGGTVIPLGQADAVTRRSSPTTIVNAPQFNLRGAIVTRELYADMQRISDQSAAQAGKVAYSQAMKDAPSAVARTQRYGSTI